MQKKIVVVAVVVAAALGLVDTHICTSFIYCSKNEEKRKRKHEIKGF